MEGQNATQNVFKLDMKVMPGRKIDSHNTVSSVTPRLGSHSDSSVSQPVSRHQDKTTRERVP